MTPAEAYEHIKESVAQYLETQYRISNRLVTEERARLLREPGTIAQVPFIEATPAFPTAHKLAELERLYPESVPAGIAELVQHGVPVDRFALYQHQEAALLAASGSRPNLLVATGTGSGKTEAFLLPILADILREASDWPAPIAVERRGQYDPRQGWLSSRRHEARPAAVRAIVLYPMNALVNDQLSRLRRILARGESPDWQRRNLNGNVVRFGMYTGLSRPTGPWTVKWRRDKYFQYETKVDAEWQALSERLRATGGWPRPDGPEMICRWDMQLAPPDILVTNYSMLEYMMIRPIESGVFTTTADWLASDRAHHRLTLVVDEAHTYTGAKGTEVAHLIRRLRERLGITSSPHQLRTIATTASVPDHPDADESLLRFVGDLSGARSDSFSLIKLPPADPLPDPGPATGTEIDAWARFHESFDLVEPMPAVERLVRDLDLGEADRTLDPQVALYNALERDQRIKWFRSRTARRATLLSDLSLEAFGDTLSEAQRDAAAAGVLAAGSYARASDLADTPPLLSVRVHAFFRGIAGIWACLNPNCRFAEPAGTRPVGRIFTERRVWCDCGARVLEAFSCRKCGLLFLGGIPDSQQGSLWPWTDDFTGDGQDLGAYAIFGVERPHPSEMPSFRSILTTLPSHPGEMDVREVWEVAPATDSNGRQLSPFPSQCPRCRNYRQFGVQGPNVREVVEPLRTKGPRTFSIIVEDGFRVQPRSADEGSPNHGRKALLFSDSRPEAATLAADLRRDHRNDLFRQLLYRALYVCALCDGTGSLEQVEGYVIGQATSPVIGPCNACDGSGILPSPAALQYAELRARVTRLQLERGINPSGDDIRDFFAQAEAGNPAIQQATQVWFDVNLRREISEEEFSLGPLGLAEWTIQLPETTGALAPLTEPETKQFIRIIARILATEDILLPPEPVEPWGWPRDIVREWERQVIYPGNAKQGAAIPYNLEPRRKLGRYVRAVVAALVAEGRLPNQAAGDQWLRDQHWPLWAALRGFGVLQPAGAKINGQTPHGIRIDSFALSPIGPLVWRCGECGYVSPEALLDVCPRCGQQTARLQPGDDIRNFYRRSVLAARPGPPFDDPHPLRSIEHSAQIPGAEARDLERWFQDFFRDGENALDHRIDVLSVTTTMEMGIDIGSLLTVGLRNVPPTVANYQQRAGRAGRRGSSIATVLSFAQQRSHDQYYFSRPPEIVSRPPRVPVLYLANSVIARRHVRALALEQFFRSFLPGGGTASLFSAWGKVGDFITRQGVPSLIRFLDANFDWMLERGVSVVDATFGGVVADWLKELPGEVGIAIGATPSSDELLDALLQSGLLPKYAFPVDVVSLSMPSFGASDDDDFPSSDTMQRDLKIALSEYAPGAEVIKGTFPETFVYKSAALHDPYGVVGDFRPTGSLLECQDCQAISLAGADAQGGVCGECGGLSVLPLPYLIPKGFSVDAALPGAGRQRYDGGGRERSGEVLPARLLLGGSSFALGDPTSFAPALYTYVRSGQLFMCNKGPDRDFPGFLVCPHCGRWLDADNLGTHTFPADVPPHWGQRRGPRAGSMCPNTTDFANQPILGHTFHSEVILLGVDLPTDLDAPFAAPSGRAVWYSFGTLVANAAARVLQVDPGELQVGVRPVRRPGGRLHGEVFIYDDVPGGAGYARGVGHNLDEVLRVARDLAHACPNQDCPGACYHCLLEYGNQRQHPLLDRRLGGAVLDFLIEGVRPVVPEEVEDRAAASLAAYARTSWRVSGPVAAGTTRFALVLEDSAGGRIGLWVIDPLSARPSAAERQQLLAASGMRPAVQTTFDLDRRPFWVMNNLIT
ncbi:MAG: DEAD/DEAH box helicase [Chloroflexota bacterium]